MIYLNDFSTFINEDKKSNKKYGYHITRKANIDSIMKNGLKPRIPLDYGERGDIKGIYLFKTLEDVESALEQWLGERIEEWEEKHNKDYDEVLLQVDISNTHFLDIIDSAEYEWTVTTPISSDNIELADVDFV